MKRTQPHYLSLLGFLFFIACSALLILFGLIVGLSALMTYSNEGQANVPVIILFVTISFTGVLLGVAAVVSVLKFMKQPIVDRIESTSVSRLKIAIGIIIAGLVLWIGSLAQSDQSINWLALPILTVPAVTIPIWLLLRTGRKDLHPESHWRIWSTFGLSISLTPIILFTLEIIVIIFVFLAVGIYFATNPELMTEFQDIGNQFMFTEPSSDEAMMAIVPYLTKPGVVASTLILFSVIVPLLEEAFKPLGVWLLAGKLESQAQGFSLGALCGAGFALVETLNNSGQTVDWTEILFTRIGTGAMHITTSALIGGAIVLAWREQRYLRLLATYLLGVFLHGLWNFIAVTNGFSSVLVTYGEQNNYQVIESASTVGLYILTLILIAILVISNRNQPRETDSAPLVESVTAEDKDMAN